LSRPKSCIEKKDTKVLAKTEILAYKQQVESHQKRQQIAHAH